MASSPRPRRDRKLLAASLAGLTLWLAAVVTLTLWRHPYFWLQPAEHYVRAQRLFETGEPVGGRRELEAAMRKAPENAGYRIYSGYRLLDSRDFAAAERTFREALRLDARRAEARLGLARALAERHRRDEALTELDRIPPDGMTRDQLRRRSQLYGMLEGRARLGSPPVRRGGVAVRGAGGPCARRAGPSADACVRPSRSRTP
jgi:predicted Zn-dependent protease